MSDSDDRPARGRLQSVRDSMAESLSPGVLVRLQYASYLFFALLTCLVLKGTVGHVMAGVPYLREGCVYSDSGTHDNRITAAAAEYASHICYGDTFVYRVSFSLFVFFLLLFISVSDLTCCVEDRARAQMQSGLFCWKSAMLVLINFVALWIPNGFFVAYAWAAMIVSGIFLVVQVMLIVDFAYAVNEEWGSRSEENSKWQWYLAAAAFLSYGAGVGMTVYSFIEFTPASDCNLHGFILTLNVVAAIACTAVAVWVPHGSIVPSGLVFAYTAFLLLTALRLDPDPTCNTLAESTRQGVGSIKMTLISALVSAVALAYTVVSSSGADTAASLTIDDAPANDDDDAGDRSGLVSGRRRFDTAVGHLPAYCFFYLVMMAGAMYLAMLATDWKISGSSDGGVPQQPSGGTATGTAVAMWVKIATSWMAIAMYLWSLLAPYFCCADRDFGYGVEDW
eukprot:CAMPEP_0174840324 /NCGR_PEP_ID=MMETSP1114-20130205/8616_1 /TAXON_ID=312471 /ORGANISM="Neobodo designis, Strain CCAP 1951/1" /LENGTH=450 /DNA_ID=CAMNT_0016074469 /DNA_START=37 /DNA_END=1389 /DNA_ORIENTATION=+